MIDRKKEKQDIGYMKQCTFTVVAKRKKKKKREKKKSKLTKYVI